MSANIKSTETILERCSEMITEINKIKGTNAKKEAFKKYDDLFPLIQKIWDPNTTTGITIASLKKFNKPLGGTDYGLIDLLDALSERKITGDAARIAVLNICNKHPKYKDLIMMIYEKDLKMRIGATTIEDIFPGIFHIYKVALAKEWDDAVFKRKLEEHKKAYMSQKIDGVRVAIFISLSGVSFKSREGNEFTSLASWKPALLELYQFAPPDADARGGMVIDAEIVEVDEKGNIDFKATVSAVKQKDVQMKNPRFYTFDLLYKDEFDCKKTSPIFHERYDLLKKTMEEFKNPHIDVLEQELYTPEGFEILKKKAIKENWEGVMIRFDTIYEGKRTNNLMKWKRFFTEEYKVEDIVVKDMPFPNDKGGSDIIKCLNSVIIKHKGGQVNVGSGFTKAERIKYVEHPEEIVGKLISVQYQEEFQDATTKKWSLRLPTFITIIGEKRDF